MHPQCLSFRYPDLIDKTLAPTHAPPPPPPVHSLQPNTPFSYRITRDKDPDTCIITFHAGPPYEDIAFRSTPPLHGLSSSGRVR